MKMKRSYLLLNFTFLLIVTLCLSACGKSDDSPTIEPPKPPKPELTDLEESNTTANLAFDDYNKAFLVSNGALQYYREALNTDTKDYFWCQALDILMVEDTYLRTKKRAHKTLINNLLLTFLEQNKGSGGLYDWNWNEFNDDLLWAGLVFVRGYQLTGNSVYLTQAEYAFNRLYNRGWDNNLGGGIWWAIWTSSNTSAGATHYNDVAKSGLSNNPAITMACYLYECTGKPEYLAKAVAIYTWVRNTLYVESTGGVDENIKPGNVLSKSYNVYNSGAFIEAANYLHRLTGNSSYYDDAKKAVDFVINQRTENGIMTSGQRGGTWQSEFSRGMGDFVRDNNMWATYYEWMKKNANAAWAIRRTDKNIAWNKWTVATPIEDKTAAVECVGAVIQQQVTPLTNPELKSNATYYIRPKINNGSALTIAGSGTSDGTTVEMNVSNNGANQQLKIISAGYGYYKLEPANALGKYLTVSGTNVVIATSNNGNEQLWKLVYDYSGYFKLKPKKSPLLCLIVSGSEPIDGNKCVVSKVTNIDKERWLFEKVQ